MKPTKRKDLKTFPNLLFVVVLIALALIAVLLARQAANTQPISQSAPATPLLPTEAIEQAGWVEARQVEGVQTVYLFAQPNAKAEKVGEILPGTRGELLGQDASGEWLYVRFDHQQGWAPIYFFDITVVQ